VGELAARAAVLLKSAAAVKADPRNARYLKREKLILTPSYSVPTSIYYE
jgi:hypothetical protein